MPSYRVTKRALEVGEEVIETPEGVTPLITPDGSHIIIVEDVSDQVSRQAARAAGRAAAKAAKVAPIKRG